MENKVKKRGLPLPDLFEVTPEMRLWALGRTITDQEIAEQTEQFKDHARMNGVLHVDWRAAWRFWLRNYVAKFRRFDKTAQHNPQTARKLN